MIGINSQIETGGGGNGNVGIGFAIPINTARDVVSQLEQNGKVEHAFLGHHRRRRSPHRWRRRSTCRSTDGVLVQDVVQGGPADKAGIKGGDTAATIDGANLSLGGDIITAIDGKKISSMDEVVNLVNARQPGRPLDLTILRGGETQSVDA